MNILDYLPLSQAAQALGYASTSYLRLQCREGKIPGAVHQGKLWFIPRVWIEHQLMYGQSGQGARGKPRK